MDAILMLASTPFDHQKQYPNVYLSGIMYFMQKFVPNYTQEQTESLELIVKNLKEAYKVDLEKKDEEIVQLKAQLQAVHCQNENVAYSSPTISDDQSIGSDEGSSMTDENVRLLQEKDQTIEILKKQLEKLKLDNESYEKSFFIVNDMYATAEIEQMKKKLNKMNVKHRALCDYYRCRLDCKTIYSNEEKECLEREMEEQKRISNELKKKLDAALEHIDVLNAEIEDLKQRPKVDF
ncbi:FRIGIDA-like protein [Caenorhabditis elegans]|uniref:FRIGIDA-like protein n=1 Tax=Caenorhabditis elegans TaxID=6239 RepID=Q8T7Y5_CAEEL|nr:FRIGIDA-like protein [Caenorhabditis elegans]CCD67036.2 FRIGIDA-like protein [Caenorhabditis elegans]|eukprot:NP_741509.2 Uncharacterized protein CELE_K02H11.9 [Caenorhabditis elegans]